MDGSEFTRSIVRVSPPRFLPRAQVLYNGHPASALPARLERLIGYVDQLDIHVPQLTVRETFEFALRTSVVVRRTLAARG